MSNLFENIDENEDIFGDKNKSPKARETTPDYFAELEQPSQMSLFSPLKPLDPLFDFPEQKLLQEDIGLLDEQNDPFASTTGNNDDPLFGSKENKDHPLFPVEENESDVMVNGKEKDDVSVDPFGILGDTDEDKFEVIDISEVPSVEDAERELEAVRRETERKKKEEEDLTQEEEDLEEDTNGDEVTDGGAFSKIFFGTRLDQPTDNDPLTTSSPPLTDSEELVSPLDGTDKNAEQLAESQREISQLNMKLRDVQSENAGLKNEVDQLRQQLDAEREKTKRLEDNLKEKEIELNALKDGNKSVSKPSPSTRRPPLSSTKQTSVSSPRAKLRAESERGKVTSVAEAVKKFSAPESKKPSPPTTVRQRQTITSTRKESTEKPALRKESTEKPALRKESTEKPPAIRRETSGGKPPHQDSTTSRVTKKERPMTTVEISTPSVTMTKREKAEAQLALLKEEKRISSPPKPQRARTRTGSQTKIEKTPESSPPIDKKDLDNTLDAISKWEKKTSDTDTKSPVHKNALSPQRSLPIKSLKTEETISNQENEIPEIREPSVEKEKQEEKKQDEKNEEKEEEKVPLRQSGITSQIRKFKSGSVIVSGPHGGGIGGPTGKKWGTATVEKCQVCKRTVYQLERLQADEKVYHKSCFRCSHCKKVVGLGTYAANKGEIFCKTHFKMLFKIKGNYDEGFGREQHKAKWSGNNYTPSPEPHTLTQ